MGIEPTASNIVAISISRWIIHHLDAGLGTEIPEKGKGPKEKILSNNPQQINENQIQTVNDILKNYKNGVKVEEIFQIMKQFNKKE